MGPLRCRVVGVLGSRLRLDAVSVGHVDALLEAASGDRASFAFTIVPGDRAAMVAYVEQALAEQAAGRGQAYVAVDLADGRVIGSSRFMNQQRWVEPDVLVAEIGYTWLTAEAQGSGANAEMKSLMLTHAFEDLGMARVSFMTDARNARSRAALHKLGARFEGVRRAHMPAFDGGIRDSAFFSILADEWPQVRAGLRERLAR
ncbi:Protein N-acetyltransferase, RimJ/RimL family [Actinokineospora globicatena]|nr:Protein N-acetyltransferase, RimJ/RimL family [Actinokineospora globicatena]